MPAAAYTFDAPPPGGARQYQRQAAIGRRTKLMNTKGREKMDRHNDFGF
jgi:hypothetical protein